MALMKVKELINKLGQLNPDTDVLCYTEDEALLPKGQLFRLLDIESVSEAEGEKCRLDDNTPYMKLGKGSASQKHVFIGVTGVF